MYLYKYSQENPPNKKGANEQYYRSFHSFEDLQSPGGGFMYVQVYKPQHRR